jgi:hypothetical protein
VVGDQEQGKKEAEEAKQQLIDHGRIDSAKHRLMPGGAGGME